MRYGWSGLLRVFPLKAVIFILGYAFPLGHEPVHLGVLEKLFHCFLLTVTTYKFDITTILITNILLIWRVKFMELGCQGARKWEKVVNHLTDRVEYWEVLSEWHDVRFDAAHFRFLAALQYFFDVFYPCCLANNDSTLFCACWNWNEALPAPDAIVIFSNYLCMMAERSMVVLPTEVMDRKISITILHLNPSVDAES